MIIHQLFHFFSFERIKNQTNQKIGFFFEQNRELDTNRNALKTRNLVFEFIYSETLKFNSQTHSGFDSFDFDSIRFSSIQFDFDLVSIKFDTFTVMS
jgi:hypothetical protein